MWFGYRGRCKPRGFERYRAQRLALFRAERRFDGPFWRRRQAMEQPW